MADQRPGRHLLDTTGLFCPLPIVKTAARIKEIAVGDVLVVLSDDAGIIQDMPAWCKSNGQELLAIEKSGGQYKATIRRLR
ncbi:MAG: sulfurtransferase TusA family protein [Acidobacteriota bacterium]